MGSRYWYVVKIRGTMKSIYVSTSVATHVGNNLKAFYAGNNLNAVYESTWEANYLRGYVGRYVGQFIYLNRPFYLAYFPI